MRESAGTAMASVWTPVACSNTPCGRRLRLSCRPGRDNDTGSGLEGTAGQIDISNPFLLARQTANKASGRGLSRLVSRYDPGGLVHRCYPALDVVLVGDEEPACWPSTPPSTPSVACVIWPRRSLLRRARLCNAAPSRRTYPTPQRG